LRSRRAIWIAIAFLLAEAAAMVDGFLIEPYWIEVTHHTIHAGMPAFGIAPLKIAHLTDLHTHGVGVLERRLLAKLAAEKPDVIVITGDTLSGFTGTYEEVHELLKDLHAPLGVWIVRGNRENGRPVPDERAFYSSAGVHFLLNEAQPIRDGVWITGLDDPYSGKPDLDAALRGVPAGAYTIALFHAPAYFDAIAGRVPLALAGHTHGGQVIFPLIHPVWLPKGSGRFLAGWYEEEGSRLYVSRGIGTTFLPVRFLCRSELAIITIEP
jgi:predicted MPP superfamily phosphohydrolase